MDKSQLDKLTSKELDAMANELIEKIGDDDVSEKDFCDLLEIAVAAGKAQCREESNTPAEAMDMKIQEKISVLIFALTHDSGIFEGMDITEARKELDRYLRDCLNPTLI